MAFPSDIHNQIGSINNTNGLIHTQMVYRSNYSTTIITTTYGLNGLPAVRSGFQNMHLLHSPSSTSSSPAYWGGVVFPDRPVIPMIRSYQPRPPGLIMSNPHMMIRETHVPVQPTQTGPTFPDHTLNLNFMRFQPPRVALAPHFPLNNISSPTTLSGFHGRTGDMRNQQSSSQTYHYENISPNPIMHTATRFRPPPSFSSNINIGRASIMSDNQISLPTLVRATRFRTSSQSQFVPNHGPSTSSSIIKEEPRDDHQQTHVARESTTTTVAAASIAIATTSSRPRRPKPMGEYTCFECGKSFASGSALGGHMSSHAKKRKLEAATSGKRFKPGDSFFDYVHHSPGFENGSSSRTATSPPTMSINGPSGPVLTKVPKELKNLRGNEKKQSRRMGMKRDLLLGNKRH
ncbi:hypothetical protein Pyn_30864 [Prunus yedoensis var. nudiflora]|uniref:C2H2-type domain-containing protein n=1 Tax=Prunus yedoensis var. nudiflora TaxID=2094558 RepID=A0A314U948_PRUYE|nr:hypothetical protein Pyn_30864 [Prunus yedoensis var. nudiflora]